MIIPLPYVVLERDVGLLERSSHLRTGFTEAIKQYFIHNKQQESKSPD